MFERLGRTEECDEQILFYLSERGKGGLHTLPPGSYMSIPRNLSPFCKYEKKNVILNKNQMKAN